MPLSSQNPSASAGGLGLAIVLASSTPLVLLDGAFVVRAASGTFCRMFDLEPAEVTGKALLSLGSGEWNLSRLKSLLDATLSGNAAIDAYELDMVHNGQVQHLILNAQRLDMGQDDGLSLLLAVNNVTDARRMEEQKDTLVREKQILLQELQHRVANSLQIIASVLMLGARNVNSAEARTHLNDAHQRVMAIAKMQRQLTTSGAEGVPLGTYLRDLCGSIAASMIARPDRLTITTSIDDTVATAEQSVSIGLIVTELVINALKHAFADEHDEGKIDVRFTSTPAGWTLAVEDNGRGMPAHAEPGLGTGIIDALARQLKARVEVHAAHPGTRVVLQHDNAA